jgi:hypothetical protein
LAKDTYNNVPTSEDPIFQKLSGQAVGREFLKREEKSFHTLVVLFADLVRDDVARELQRQPLEEVSKGFVDAAHVLLGHKPSADNTELRAASEFVQSQIAEELGKGIAAPDAEEIQDHVYELSQCLLGNWFAILQKANRLRMPSMHSLRLNANALPLNVFASSLLFQGLELYVLSNDLVEARFKAFLEKISQASFFQSVTAFLRRSTFKAIELAPDLVLVSGGKDVWYLTSSPQEAEALSQQLEPPRATPEPDWGAFNPQWATAGVAACRPMEKAHWDNAMVLEAIDLTVDDVILEYQQGAQILQAGGTPILAHEMVFIALEGLKPSAVSSSAADSIVQSRVGNICRVLEAHAPRTGAPVLEMCQVVVGAASKAVGAAVQLHASKQGFRKAARPRIRYGEPPMNLPPEAKRVVKVAREAVLEMLQEPEVKSSIASMALMRTP